MSRRKSRFATSATTGFLLVSDQGSRRFHVFRREIASDRPRSHEHVACVDVEATQSDGSEAVSQPLGARFPAGLFVAMSDDRTYHFYDWREFAHALEPR